MAVRDPHLHLYGALTPAELLTLAAGRAIDWGPAAEAWRSAGAEPPDFAALALAARHGGAEDAGARLAAALRALPPGTASLTARFALVHACTRWGSAPHRHWDAAIAEEVERACAWVGGRWPAEARVQIPADAHPRWVEAALAHLAGAAARHGLLLSISLPRAAPLAHWPLVAAAAAAHPVIIGIDLAGIEDEPTRHAPLAAAIAAWNRAHAPRRLQLLVHVGEQLDLVPPLTALRRVWDAVAIGADRLGHALAARLDPAWWPPGPRWQRADGRRADLAWLQWQAADLGLDADALDAELAELARLDPAQQVPLPPVDPGLLAACQAAVRERLRATQRTVECCPTSNLAMTGAPLAAHGYERLEGLAWTIGTDDPGLLGTTLERERQLVPCLPS